jgi:hypothetical protein
MRAFSLRSLLSQSTGAGNSHLAEEGPAVDLPSRTQPGFAVMLPDCHAAGN